MPQDIIVITDTSVLVNFLVLDRVRLLASMSQRKFVVTDHVRAEVTAHYSEQLSRLEQAFDSDMLEEIAVRDLEEVELFASLTGTGLGIGECSAIAVAVHRQLALAIDDKTAIKQVRKRWSEIAIFTTESLVVEMIREGILSVDEADAMKSDWEIKHRFRLKFDSFGDKL